MTFLELRDQVFSLAAELKTKVMPGGRVLLLFPSGIEYIVAFYATIVAGCIAVPAYPPQNQRRDWERLNKIVRDCRPELILFKSLKGDNGNSMPNHNAVSYTHLTLPTILLV